MFLYLIKSGTCLAIFLAFYKLFLERENMHTFKRFYLIGVLVAALGFPLITIVEYGSLPHIQQFQDETGSTVQNAINTHNDIDPMAYLPTFLWGLYGLGVLVFGFKFLKNLYLILHRIHINPKYKFNRITHVLMQNRVIPHTFFHYIFLNKQRFETNQIPKEVLLHEETHAKQKHSVDILLIELIQVLFWFNPLVYLTKKAIKLNHEFLADREVLTHGIPSNTYQKILLGFSSNPYSSPSVELANAINYSSIKKRFTVMKTKTSKKAIVLRSVFVPPLLAIMLYAFSDRKVVAAPIFPEQDPQSIGQSLRSETIEIRISKKGEILAGDSTVIPIERLKSFLLKHHTNLTKEQRSNRIRAIIRPAAEAPIEILKNVEAVLIDYGVAQVNLIGPEASFDPNRDTNTQKGATIAQIRTFNSLAQKYNQQPLASRRIPLKDLRILENIYQSMSGQQRNEAVPFPECPSQEGVTKKQIKEYNALAKKYNRQLSDAKEIHILKSDVERLEYLHGLMTHEQKENAEPFPDLPEPPTPPVPPSPLDHNADSIMQEIIANQDPYDNLNTPDAISSAKKTGFFLQKEDKAEFEETNDIPTPPEPQKTISPLDLLIEMDMKGALFYYKGKEITPDKALNLLTKDEDLSIDINQKNDNPPIVKIRH